ncbi:MAG: LapA family protein [Syntrophaceae bacterium]|nr:LapA family protein [Syntrophaceae bacterium]
MNYKFILILIAVSLSAIFVIQNVEAVDVTFLFWSISMSRALLIVFAIIIGVILGWFAHSYFSYRRLKDYSSNGL